MMESVDEEIHDQNHWDNCCGKPSDKRLLVFIANLTISLILMIFSLVRLCSPNINSDEKQTYVSFISLVVGIWLKSPLS